VFLTITLPLTLPGIIVGTVLAFARSLGSLARPSRSSPIFPAKRAPSFGDVHLDSDPGRGGAAARLCLIAIGLALVSLLISEWLARVSRQRMGG
jgi:molybdate transport system permease protein